LSLDDAPGDPCNFDVDPPLVTDDIVSAAALTQLNGSATVVTSVGGTLITTFVGASANISIDDYSALCVPIDYAIVLDGAAQVALTASGDGSGAGINETQFDVTFDGYRVGATVAGAVITIALGGALESPCFGGRAEISTPELVEVPFGEICPTDGTVVVDGIGRLLFMGGGVGIDTDNDGSADTTHPSCIAEPLLLCPA
jgi:hypothetical protein